MKKLSETYKELGINFTLPIEIKDSNGNRTYYESSIYWSRHEYDVNGNKTYFENSNGYWRRYEYNSNGKVTYYENSQGAKYGTPKSQSCDGKVVVIDGKKYKLTEL